MQMIEAMKQALEALEEACGDRCNAEYNPCHARTAITSLRQAIEQAEKQEPVGEVSGHDWSTGLLYRDLEPGTLLYTAPRATSAQMAAIPEGWSLVAVKGFNDLMYWLDRCESKGHLENCPDLIEPYHAFDYRPVTTPQSQPADPAIPEGWERRMVIGFDALVEALDYAERKGFMPDYIASAWEGFNYMSDEGGQ
jgi:uncharacterized protein YbdZ (MbtH family)